MYHIFDEVTSPKQEHTITMLMMHIHGGAASGGTAQQVGRSWVRFPIESLEFFIDLTLPAALWSWDRLSL